MKYSWGFRFRTWLRTQPGQVRIEDWDSEVSSEDIPVLEDPVPGMVDVRVTPAIRVSLECLDIINWCDEFTMKAAVMKSVAHILMGPNRNWPTIRFRGLQVDASLARKQEVRWERFCGDAQEAEYGHSIE